MAGPPLLPGEHEELRLRPAAAGWLGRYAQALVPAVGGLAFWALAAWRGVWENPQASAPDWQFWLHFWGDDQALAFYVVLALVAFCIVHYLLRRRVRAFIVGTAALLAIMAGSSIFRGLHMPTSTALPILLACLSLPALAWAEWRRRNTWYLFTNLRFVVRTTGPLRREESVRHQDLVDLQARPGMGDVGALVPVLGRDAAASGAAAPRLQGIRPFARLKPFAELLVQRATAGDYLRAEERLDQRIAEARSALQRR
ncbi:MAG: hypothetical protein V4510_09310 [bacterium]